MVNPMSAVSGIFPTSPPLERPERFGDREFLADGELEGILQSRDERVTAAAAAREAATSERTLNTENARSVRGCE